MSPSKLNFPSQQLLVNYGRSPQDLIEAVVEANRTRKGFVADEVLQMAWDRAYAGKPKPVVGMYRLTMTPLRRNSFARRVFVPRKHMIERRISMRLSVSMIQFHIREDLDSE